MNAYGNRSIASPDIRTFIVNRQASQVIMVRPCRPSRNDAVFTHYTLRLHIAPSSQQWETKSPQIVGPRSPMCLTIFLAGKHTANQLNILVHLQLRCAQRGNELGLVTSQRISIQCVAPSTTVWNNCKLSLLSCMLPLAGILVFSKRLALSVLCNFATVSLYPLSVYNLAAFGTNKEC